MSILLEWSDAFIRAKADTAHSPALYIHSASCRCLQTTHMPQGQSAYKSPLPLLNALERVPVTNCSTDFSQAWALGRGAHPNSHNVPTPFPWNMLMACSLMQHKLPNPPLGLSDAQIHVCALWMHDGSSLRPGLVAEPWCAPTGPRMLLTATGKAETEQWKGSGHQAQSM